MTEPAVRIDSWELRGDTGRKALLLDSLEHQDWPGAEERRLYLVRRIEVAGPWWELGHRSRDRARALMRAAEPGWSERAAEAEAVVFETEADALACLAATLAAPPRALPWFWRSRPETRLTSGEGLRRLLLERLSLLPEIIARLMGHGRAADTLGALSGADIDALDGAVRRHCGGDGRDGQAAPRADEPRPALALPDSADVRRHLRAWQAVLEPERGERRRALTRLAAALLAWRYRPQLLRAELPDDWRVPALAAIERRIDPAPEAARRSAAPDPWAVQPPPPSTGGASGGDAERRYPDPSSKPGPPPGTRGVDGTEPDRRGDTPETPRAIPQWRTETGGLLLLLNALHQTPLRAAVSASELPPWLWFYRLLEALGWMPDAGLQALIADRLGLDDVGDLAGLPAMADPEGHCARLHGRYARHGFWQEARWWRIPADLAADEARLDVYFHADAARADVRRAGLDIDPGWLPWLGTVVHFHYVPDATLRPSISAAGPA